MKIILTILLSITTVMFAQDKPELPGWGYNGNECIRYKHL